ncbi:MAG: hypothetical protein GF344_10755 [Chitinivibrionales bacterium]|nr:hypothetical protein [Chitinivibrionales bacterium]
MELYNEELSNLTQFDESTVNVLLSEGLEELTESNWNGINYRKSSEGIFGSIKTHIVPANDGAAIERNALSLYRSIFGFISEYPEYELVRIWHFVPLIVNEMDRSAPDVEGYRCFNSGRFKAFRERYGNEISQWRIPAATAVGAQDEYLSIEFFASSAPCHFFENKVQIPAYRYSKKYGKLPPVFVRGALCHLKDATLLITSGTASVVMEDSIHEDDLCGQIRQTFDNLKVLSDKANLKNYGLNFAFGFDDLTVLRVYYKNSEEKECIEKEIGKYVSPECNVHYVNTDICRKELVIEIEGIYKKIIC